MMLWPNMNKNKNKSVYVWGGKFSPLGLGSYILITYSLEGHSLLDWYFYTYLCFNSSNYLFNGML